LGTRDIYLKPQKEDHVRISMAPTTISPLPESNDSPDSSGWSATHYNKAAPFVYSPEFTAPVLDLLAAKPGERIIDFGCGSGEVTMKIAEIVGSGGGLVVGVDFSENMVSHLGHAILPEAIKS
jgi:SAM-dependent methyltransferase